MDSNDRRGIGPSVERKRWKAGAAAAGLVAISAVVLLAPSGLGAHAASVVISPPYTASVSPSMSSGTTGCGSAGSNPGWNFHAPIGRGGGSLWAKSSECSALFGSSSYSYSTATGGFEVGILIHIPTNGPHHIASNVYAAWRAAGGAFDGSRTGSCPAAATPTSVTYVDYFDGTNWSYSVPTGGPVLNNSTYYYYGPETYAYGTCYTESFALVEYSTWVTDVSTGASYYPGAPSYGATYLAEEQTSTYNYTNWYCANYTLWSFGTWANQSYSCYNGNVTTTTNSTNFVSGASGSSTSYSNSGTSTATTWVNGTFYHNHKYVLFVDLLAEAYTYVYGWTHGSAAASVNLSSHGNGLWVNWIKVS